MLTYGHSGLSQVTKEFTTADRELCPVGPMVAIIDVQTWLSARFKQLSSPGFSSGLVSSLWVHLFCAISYRYRPDKVPGWTRIRSLISV